MKYRVCYDSTKANNHRKSEDRHMCVDYQFSEDEVIHCYVVCDGMGGYANGDKAAELALLGYLEKLNSNLAAIYIENSEYMMNFSIVNHVDELTEAMVNAISYANKKVCDESDPLAKCGTTLSAICVVHDCAVIVNVGDSPIFFYRKQTEELSMVSALQTQAELDVANQLYERYSEEYFENDYIIYNCLGQYNKIKDIHTNFIGRIKDGDRFLMGSDGAFGRKTEEDIQLLLSKCERRDEGFFLQRLFSESKLEKDDDQTAYLITAEE